MMESTVLTKETAVGLPPIRKTPWQRLWKDKVARLGIMVLFLLYFCAAFADPLTPYSMFYSDADLANAPPTPVHFEDAKNELAWPYVYQVERQFDPATFRQTYVEKNDKKFPLQLFVKGEPYKVFGIIPGDIHLFGVESPARLFLLGSDINGRDNFSRLFFGAQKSLTIGFLGLLVAFPIGIIYGGVAALPEGLWTT